MKSHIVLLLNNPYVTDYRAWKLASSLAAAGYAVTVVGRPGEGLPVRAEADGVTIIRIAQPAPRWLPTPRLPDPADGRRDIRSVARETVGRVAQAARYLWLTRAWAAQIGETVAVADAWIAEGLITLPVALELARRHGGRVIYDSPDLHVESARFARLPGPWRRLLKGRERAWIRACDALFTASRANAEVLWRTTGCRADVLLNGPLLASLTLPRDRRLHAAVGIDPALPLVLALGQIVPGRGIGDLIEAMDRLPGVHLAIVGYGSLVEPLRARAAAGQAADRIHFLPAAAPAEIPALNAAADLAAIPIEPTTVNHRLTVPTKLFDAMGAGTPVVATSLPGMAEIVEPTGCGLLCRPNDPDDLARAIRAILEAPAEERAAYGEAGRRAVAETYAWDRQMRVVLDRLAALGLRSEP